MSRTTVAEAGPALEAAPDRAGERQPRYAHWPSVIVASLVLVPVLMSIARVAGSGWVPSGDQAMEVLRMHDVGTSDTPLLGPYSRFGWDHPGPLLFWIGAPALRLAGPVGVMVLIGLLNGAAVLGTLAAARRLAGPGFALLVGAGTALLIHSHGAVKLVDPWNPWITVLPLLCYLFTVPVAASASGAARWPLAAAIATGSFVAQSHLGNLPVVLAAAVAGGVWWFALGRTRGDLTAPSLGGAGPAHPRISRRRWPWAAGMVLVLWAGPIVDQVTGSPGNAGELIEFITAGQEKPESLQASLGAAARELGAPPAWAGATEGIWPVDAAPVWTLLIAPAVLALGCLPAVRRRTGGPPERVPLAAFAAVVHLASAFTVTRTTGGLIPYVLRWTWPVALFTTAVALLPVVDRLCSDPKLRLAGTAGDPDPNAGPGGTRPDRTTTTVGGVAAAAAVLVTAVLVVSTVVEARSVPILPSPHTDRSTSELADAVARALPPGRYGLEWIDVRSFSAISIGTGVDLVRRGYYIDFPEDHAGRIGEFRATGRTDIPLLAIVGQTPRRWWRPPEGSERLVRWDHLSTDDRARADALEQQVRRDARLAPDKLLAVDTTQARDYLVARGADPADVAELHGLQADREWYEVWLLPAGSDRDI